MSETTQMCGCGCGGPAVFVVTGFDFDPRAPGGRGEPFTAPSCTASADYLTEGSEELGFPYTKTRLE